MGYFQKEVDQLRQLIGVRAGRVNIVCLEGDLGAGKTTFVQEYLHSFSEDFQEVQSPTFLKLLEYEIVDLGLVLHIDAYRMEDEEDLAKLSLESYEDPALIFVEWPELFLGYLRNNPTLLHMWGVSECLSLKIGERNHEVSFEQRTLR